MPRTELKEGNIYFYKELYLCLYSYPQRSSTAHFVFCPCWYLSRYFIFPSLQVQYQNLVNELIKNFIIFHEVNLNTHFFSNQYKLRWMCSLNTRICLTRSSDCLSPIGHLPERWRRNCLREIHLQRT